jgi:hypothetical protein
VVLRGDDLGARKRCVRAFFQWFYQRLATWPGYRDEIEKLRGHDLKCFCAPALCHGDVYKGYLDATSSGATPLVFVFGSNLAGCHGVGDALDAVNYWGAKFGVGEGGQGSSYAIPTKDAALRTLPIDAIALSTHQFLMVAKSTPSTAYVVTRVGCRDEYRDEYRDEEIAPMFADAPRNCILDPVWQRDWKAKP